MTENSLYTRLGGQPGIARLVEGMFRRVMADPTLEPFFRDASIDHLRHMQTVYFSAAFDGPEVAGNPGLAHIHRGMGITRAHFSRLIECLLEAMEEMGVEQADIDLAVGRMATYADDLIGEANVDG